MKLSALFFAISFLAIGVGESRAEEGVSSGEVLVGMSNALSGPSKELGIGVKEGAEAYFRKINSAGGIHGRKIKLISLDDGYEPSAAAKNTEKLIGEDKVFALFGYVGTPTSAAVMPTVGKAKIPYVAPFTGAEALRNPVNPQVFNVRASYFDETEGLVQHFMDDLGIKKIGIFIQDDGYGAAGEAGVRRALGKRGQQIAGKGAYTRNTADIDAGYEKVKQAAPEAVILIGTYKACAAFAKKAKADKWAPKIANVSFVGTNALIKEMGSAGEGVYISQVMPAPTDSSAGLVKAYQKDMKAAGKGDFDYTSLEGYADAMVLAEGLKAAGKDLTREGFRRALESMSTDLGGLRVTFTPESHSGSNAVYFTEVHGGKAVQISSFK